jgi:hypothetical protein
MTTIATTAEAEKAIAQVADLIDKLRGVVEQETALVHAGDLRNAATLGPQKSELTSKLSVAGEGLKANAKFLLQAAPASAAALRNVQEAFRTVLQRNMIVLATAHAVSEGIVRGVNTEIQRRNIPNTYTSAGQRQAPGPRNITPLSVSRSL